MAAGSGSIRHPVKDPPSASHCQKSPLDSSQPPPDMQDIEKLGAFYLGRMYDTSARQTSPDAVLYDSKDLVTHAVCVGMTGSGKTGLCVDLLEEAAIDGIPSLV